MRALNYRTLCCFGLLLAVSLPLHAQDSLNVHRVGGLAIPAAGYAVVVRDTLAFVAAGDAGLVIFNVADPAQPMLLSHCNTRFNCFSRGPAIDLRLAGNYVFIAEQLPITDGLPNAGFSVVDIADPAQPQLVTHADMPGSCVDMELVGSHVFLNVGRDDLDYGLRVLDVSNPSQPILLNTPQPFTDTDYLARDNSGLVLLNDSHVIRLDLTDPAQPVAIDTISVCSFEGPCFLRDWIQSGDYGYALAARDGIYTLYAVSLAGPGEPVVVDTLAFLNTQVDAMALDGSHLFLTSSSPVPDSSKHLWVVNISDPEQLSLAGDWAVSALEPHTTAVFVREGYAYVAGMPDLLRIVDITNPPQPVLAGSWWGGHHPRLTALAGNHLLVASDQPGGGLVAVDVSDPAFPVVIGARPTTHPTLRLLVQGSYAFLNVQSVGVEILDIANPPAMPLVATVLSAEPVEQLALGADHLYLSNGGPQIRIVDITDPAQPVESGTFTSAGGPLFASNRFLYSASFVYDLSDPAVPVLVDTLEETSILAVSDSSVIATDRAFRVSSGGLHQPLGDLTRTLERAVISGSYAVGLTSVDGPEPVMSVFYLDNPDSVQEIGYYARCCQLPHAALRDSTIFAIGNENAVFDQPRLLAYQFTPVAPLASPPSPSPAPTGFALAPCYPNPFNSTAILEFELPVREFVSLKVYDTAGRRVRTLVEGPFNAGRHNVRLEAGDLPSGLYFVRLEASQRSQTRKLILLK